MRHFLQLFPQKFIEMQSHGSFLEKLHSFGQMDDFSCFFTNWAIFCNLLLKSSSKHQNMVVCAKKLHSFCQIDEFSCFFTKWGSFCNCLPKSSSKRKNMVLCSKSCKFWPNPWFFVLFHELSRFLQPFAERFIETPKHGSLLQKVARFWPNRWVVVLFHEMRQFLELFAEKFIETSKHGSFFEKLQVFRKCMSFRAFSRNEPLLPTFSLKVHRNAKTWKFARKVA